MRSGFGEPLRHGAAAALAAIASPDGPEPAPASCGRGVARPECHPAALRVAYRLVGRLVERHPETGEHQSPERRAAALSFATTASVTGATMDMRAGPS
jgi:hypothetical protein